MKKITAVIMAAGKGTRLLPLTSSTPKPLIKVLGQSPLEENLENLHLFADEIVIVVGHLKEKIIDSIGNIYKGRKIKYVTQQHPEGTAHALMSARDVISNDKILALNGDDIYERSLIKKALNMNNNLILGIEVENWKHYGILKADKDNNLRKIIEKPKKFVGNLVNIGLYKVDKKVFGYFEKINKSERGEYEITDLITSYASEHPVKVVGCQSGWTPFAYPWDLLQYVENKLKNIKIKIKGKVEKGVVIKGKLVLGKNSIIKSGSYLEGNFYIGDNCEIGPNCYLKDFGSFEKGCAIGNAVEITRSIIGENTKIKHLAYVGDSIIGNSVNIAAGTITANFRHDSSNIFVKINGKLIDSGKNKFGAIIADSVKTGINTSIYPGATLESKSTTSPGEVVKYEK